jgi:AcrR family transcriptional regulator
MFIHKVNAHSYMLPPAPFSVSINRHEQILDAAVHCFAKHGFHQTTMHHISAEAGISVGLIYRYFENKEAVIAAMADAHKTYIRETMTAARQALTLMESLDIFFAAPCADCPDVESAFLVDLYAEASRNPQVAGIVRDVSEEVRNCFIELIESSPEAQTALNRFTPTEIAELICSVHKGVAMNEIVEVRGPDAEPANVRQLRVVRSLCALLFPGAKISTKSNLPSEHANTL